MCDGALLFWDLNANDDRAMRIAENVTAIDLTADGKQFIAIDVDGMLTVRNPVTKIITSRHRVGRANGCKVAPHGREIAVWLRKGVRLVDLKSGKLIARLTHGGKTLHIVRTSSGRVLWKLPSRYFDSWVGLTPDGRHVASMDSGAGIQVWNLQR